MSFRFTGARHLIDAMGGPARVAAELGCSAPLVRMWVVRGSIPDGWWIDIVALAARLGLPGLSLEILAEWAMDRRRRSQKPSPRRARARASVSGRDRHG